MKTLMTLLIVLLVAAMPFAGTRTLSYNGPMLVAAGHTQLAQSDDDCPMGDDMDGCDMDGEDMEGCDMDGMDDMMDDCHGDGGMMGLTAPPAWGFSFRMILAALGIF